MLRQKEARKEEERKRGNCGKNWFYTEHRRLKMAKEKVWWKTRNMFTLFSYIHTYRNGRQEHEVTFLQILAECLLVHVEEKRFQGEKKKYTWEVAISPVLFCFRSRHKVGKGRGRLFIKEEDSGLAAAADHLDLSLATFQLFWWLHGL